MCICAGFDDGLIQLLFEHILKDLVEAELFESCEFHEGLNELLSSYVLVELLVGAYPDDPSKLGEVCSKLYSGGSLKPHEEEWQIIRANMSAIDFRKMLVHMIEMACDRIKNVAGLLTSVYRDDEQFEISDTLRILLEGNFILDILPSKRKAARAALLEYFVQPYPFTRKVVSDFCQDALRLEALEEPKKPDYISDKSVESSSDSDIESRGSLDDFVVDSDEEDDFASSDDSEDSSASSASESSSDGGKSKKKRVRAPSSGSSVDSPKMKPRSADFSKKKSSPKRAHVSSGSESEHSAPLKKKKSRS